jgi:hypothetical protein
LIRAALHRVFGDDLTAISELTRNEIVEKLTPFLERFGDILHQVFDGSDGGQRRRADHSDDPLNVFRWLLKH